MANEYLYGAYGHISETVAQNAIQSGTVLVYVGTAPVNLVSGYKDAGVINEPVKINNMADAQRKLGYSNNWTSFTLCEAMTAHYNNPIGNIGPIYMINVLDPDVQVKPSVTNKELNFAAGRTEFPSDTIVLDSLTLEGKEKGVDFNVNYNFIKGVVVITSVNPDEPITGTINATYKEVDTTMITDADIIGGVTTDGQYTGLGAIQLIYPKFNVVTNLIASPGWSNKPGVYNAMINASQKINGHWDAFVLADLPISAGTTIDAAISWKNTNGYNSERSKVYWPQGIDNLGRVFHLSTFSAAVFLATDFSHQSVPMETCGNKPIPVIAQYFGQDSTNRGFDQQMGNSLTSNGISTAVAWGGQWVLWGDHTAAYVYGGNVDPRAIFDVSLRMLMHITNNFQVEWGSEIDSPMTRALKDQILNREQEKLDGYVGMGALIGDPKVSFIESENPMEDIINGDFRWDILATPTPPLKSVSVYVAYTDEGFSVYFNGGEQ